MVAAAAVSWTLLGAGCGLDEDEPLPRSLSDATRQMLATAELRAELPPATFDCLLDGVDAEGVVQEALTDADGEAETEVPKQAYDAAVEVLSDCFDDQGSHGDWLVADFASSSVDLDEGAGACFAEKIQNLPDRRVIAEIALTGEGAVLTPSETDAVADILTVCVPPVPFGELWTALNPDLPADVFCVTAVARDDSKRRAVWRASPAGDNGEDRSPELEAALRRLFECPALHPVLNILDLESLPDDHSACIVDGVTTDPALAEAVAGASIRDDVIVAGQRGPLVDLILRCTEDGGLARFILPDLDAPADWDLDACLASALGIENRRAVLDGLIGSGQSQDPALRSAIVACLPGSRWAEQMARGALDEIGVTNLVRESLVDVECADQVELPVDALESMPGFETDGLAGLPPSVADFFASLWRCIRVDLMMSASLEQDSGVVLSEATLECLRPQLQELFAEQFGEGALDAAEAAGAVLSCMTPEEIEAISG